MTDKTLKNKNYLAMVIIGLILAVAFAVAFFGTRNQTSSSVTSNSVTSTDNSSVFSSSFRSNFSVALAESISMPNVGQRFDHLAYDASAQLVFIVARGNNSVYVVNLITKNASHFIRGLNEPQGVYYVPQNDRLFVSNAGDGTVDVFDGGNFSLIKTLNFSSNADNMRYDQKNGLLYVGYGEGNKSGIGIINTSSDEVMGTIPLDGHPEAFELEQNGTRIFVNVPTSSAIEVINRTTRNVVQTWPLTSALANYPMALDERDHRLFVGFWYPSEVASYDTSTGKIIASMNTSKDADDMFFDPVSHLVLVSCGQGFLDVFTQLNNGSIAVQDLVPTGILGRTSLFLPEQGELLIAVPQQNGIDAQLMIFAMGK